jgi:hypothetical protein
MSVSIPGGLRCPTALPIKSEPGADRAELPMPVSGFQLVVAHQPTGRVSVEIRDPEGLLTGVTAAAPLGRAQVRGAVRGPSWSLAYGQVADGSVAPLVRFQHRWPRRGAHAVEVRPLLIGRFWIAELPERFHTVELVGHSRAKLVRMRAGRH